MTKKQRAYRERALRGWETRRANIRSEAARKGWETRRANIEHKRRSEAAKKGWETRREREKKPPKEKPVEITSVADWLDIYDEMEDYEEEIYEGVPRFTK